MNTTIFSETIDTVRTSRQELTAAEAMLKLEIISPGGAILSTTHAIDSSLLLSNELAGNSAFRSLIQSGRLRFASWPDGKTLSQALEAVFGTSSYVLSGWPEFTSDPTIRNLALEVWKGALSTTGVDSVDNRIDLARQLFAAAESGEKRFPEKLKESSRKELFAASLTRAAEWLPKGETPKEVSKTIIELAQFEGRNSRSKVYEWIDNRDLPENAILLLKDLVDARYNKTVADSLGLHLWSSRRVWKTLPNDYHEGDANIASLKLLEASGGTSILVPIKWETIRRAVAPYCSPESYSKEDAQEAFKELIAGTARYKDSFGISGAVFGAGLHSLVTIALLGAGITWTAIILVALAEILTTGTGYALGQEVGSRLDKEWQGKLVNEYSGWLDEEESRGGHG